MALIIVIAVVLLGRSGGFAGKEPPREPPSEIGGLPLMDSEDFDALGGIEGSAYGNSDIADAVLVQTLDLGDLEITEFDSVDDLVERLKSETDAEVAEVSRPAGGSICLENKELGNQYQCLVAYENHKVTLLAGGGDLDLLEKATKDWVNASR